MLGQPDIAVGTRHSDGVGNTVDDIILFNIMRLTLRKKTADEAQWRIRGACDTQFTKAFLIPVNALNILVGVYQNTGIIVKIVTVTGQRIVKIGIIGVIQLCFSLAPQVAACRSNIPASDLSFNRQGALYPFIAAALWVILHRLKLTSGLAGTFLRVAAIRILNLPHQGWLNGPIVIQINAERQTRAIGFSVVEVILHQQPVALRNARACIGACAQHIVDITGIVAIPTDETRCGTFGDRHVHETFVNRAKITMRNIVKLNASASVETRWIRRVRHQLQRTSHRACTI